MTPRPLDDRERVEWLRLARTRGVGPVTFHQLISRYGDASDALAALPGLARRSGGRIPKIPPADAIRRELDEHDRIGARAIASLEPEFPDLLRALDPPPPVLSVLGDAALLARPAVALVGSRNASAVGRRFAQDMARDLGAAGYLIVSGLARGIDGAAHAGALETGTAAVVAGGVDHVYPPEHAELRETIAARGAIVSESPIGTVPTARDFPRRNRLISGLSLGVVVIEAAERSGSLITARFAGEQGREVMAAPGSPLDPRAKGSNRLIRDGAALVENADDVLDVLGAVAVRRAREPAPSLFDDAIAPERRDDGDGGDDLRAVVMSLLSPTPVPRDEIVRAAGAPASEVAAALLELEIAGRAHQLPGGKVAAGAGEGEF